MRPGAKGVRITGIGHCIHEIGTARRGTDAKTGVLNKYCQSHDVENLFVRDGAAWVSRGCGNPTLTMMAITVRACFVDGRCCLRKIFAGSSGLFIVRVDYERESASRGSRADEGVRPPSPIGRMRLLRLILCVRGGRHLQQRVWW